MVATLLGYGFASLFFFSRPGDPCVRASCAPLTQQVIALAAPMILVGVVIVVVAFLVNRWNWWIRTLIPPIVLVLLLFVQHSRWDSWPTTLLFIV